MTEWTDGQKRTEYKKEHTPEHQAKAPPSPNLALRIASFSYKRCLSFPLLSSPVCKRIQPQIPNKHSTAIKETRTSARLIAAGNDDTILLPRTPQTPTNEKKKVRRPERRRTKKAMRKCPIPHPPSKKEAYKTSLDCEMG